MALFDVGTWVHSREVRGALRKAHSLTVIDQAQIVHNGYGPVEDKLRDLLLLRHRAKTKEEKNHMRRIVTYYQTALRQMGLGGNLKSPRKAEAGEIWAGRCGEYQFGHARQYDYFTDRELFYSLEEARHWAGQHLKEPWQVCRLEKWILRKEKPVGLMGCSLRRVEDKLCVTHVYLDKEELGLKSIDEFVLCHRHPCKLPFSTGDLVKFDGLPFKAPVFGVLCCDPWDVSYYWMGRFLTEREKRALKSHEKRYGGTGYNGSPYDLEDLSYDNISGFYELGVMDWLHPASEEELPEEQKILAEIGRKLQGLKGKDRADIERFYEIFFCV